MNILTTNIKPVIARGIIRQYSKPEYQKNDNPPFVSGDNSVLLPSKYGEYVSIQKDGTLKICCMGACNRTWFELKSNKNDLVLNGKPSIEFRPTNYNIVITDKFEFEKCIIPEKYEYIRAYIKENPFRGYLYKNEDKGDLEPAEDRCFNALINYKKLPTVKRPVSFLEGIVMIIIGIIAWNLLLIFLHPNDKEEKVETDKITINGCEYTLTHKSNCKNPIHK